MNKLGFKGENLTSLIDFWWASFKSHTLLLLWLKSHNDTCYPEAETIIPSYLGLHESPNPSWLRPYSFIDALSSLELKMWTSPLLVNDATISLLWGLYLALLTSPSCDHCLTISIRLQSYGSLLESIIVFSDLLIFGTLTFTIISLSFPNSGDSSSKWVPIKKCSYVKLSCSGSF